MASRRTGEIDLGAPAQQVTVGSAGVTGVQIPEHHFPADAVICTTPTPLVSKLVPDLPVAWKQRYEAILRIGVICVIFKLRRSITPHFWVNISEPDLQIPGIIEFSNLRSFWRRHNRLCSLLHASDKPKVFMA